MATAAAAQGRLHCVHGGIESDDQTSRKPPKHAHESAVAANVLPAELGLWVCGAEAREGYLNIRRDTRERSCLVHPFTGT